MGYYRHNAILVVANEYIFDEDFATRHGIIAPDVEAFRESLPENWRQLVVGPVKSPLNGYITYVFCPDGGKESSPYSDMGELYQRQFLELFSFAYDDGSTPYDILLVGARFGGDEPGCGLEEELIVRSSIPNIKAIGRTLELEA